MNTESNSERQTGCPPSGGAREPISEESIGLLVDRFYTKVRKDPEIGPIFNEAVENWDAHLSLLRDFWSTVLLGTARYKGNPLLAHFPLPVAENHFERWLALFGETAHEVLIPEDADRIVAKAENIAGNFRRVLAYREEPEMPQRSA